MTTRAQTTLDFALGVSLFAAILLFVFAFVPGLLSPFTGGLHEETVTSNRIADGMVSGSLGSPAEPAVLDVSCTVWFFEHAGGSPEAAPSECRYDGETLQQRLGIDERQLVNVTVTGNTTGAVPGSSVLCWDADGRTVAQVGGGDCTDGDDVRLAAGPSAPARNDDAISAVRVGTLGGEDVTVAAELW